MREFRAILNERISELDTHLQFIGQLEAAAVGRGNGALPQPVDSEPINILKSGFLVHMYNVVEAVMTKVLEEVAVAARVHAPKTWCDGLLREWATGRVNLSRDLSRFDAENRVFTVIQESVERVELGQVSIRRRSGNWTDQEISDLATALACHMEITEAVRVAACETVFENQMPPMKYLRHKRNQLAHGNESFIDGARHIPSGRLGTLRDPIVNYILEVVEAFDQYIDDESFLHTAPV